MKHLITSILLLLLGLSSAFAQHNIEIKIKGLQDGEECILAHYYADQNKIVDTLTVRNGSIIKKGNDKLLNGVYIVVLPKRTWVEFIVPNDDQNFLIQFDTSVRAENKMASGSDDNAAFFEFDKFAAIQGTKMRDLREKYESTTDETLKTKLQEEMSGINKAVDQKRRELIDAYPTTFTAKLFRTVLEIEIPETLKNDTTGKRFLYYREHYWDHFDLTDDGILRTPVYKGKLEYYMSKLFIQTPDSVIPAIDAMIARVDNPSSRELYKYTVWWNTNHFEESDLMCMDKVLHHMASDYYCAGKCYWADSALVAKMCEHASKIGPTLCDKVAPNLVLVDTSFKVTYELHKIQYPVTVVVFWDHECGHCKKEIPKLKAMYDTLNSKGVQVYAVYTKADWQGWKKYIKENKLNWINVMDAYNKSNYRKEYNIISTPQVYILDKDKVIRFKNPPADNVGKIAEILLEEYKKELESQQGESGATGG